MNQLKKQILKEETTSMPESNLLAFNGFKKIKKFLKGCIALLVILILSLVATTISETSIRASSDKTLNNELLYINSVRVRSTQKLISEVDIYMKQVAPTTKLNANTLVELCNKYDMNIVFVLAQGILESHLGTKGKALTTNSVWNVGSYDNGIIHYTYKNPNESIEPYLKLIKERYLTKVSEKGDTISKEIKNLIQDRGFVNSEGYRYASSNIYENSLRNMIIKISMESSINLYQAIIGLPDNEIVAYFLPPQYMEISDSTLTANL
ncbi:MAG: glucosaminidase domain-containing protein [Clostridia bacterium]